MNDDDRVQVLDTEILSDNWYVLKKTTFRYRRADGHSQTLSRETYDRGNGATMLLYNLEQRTVILTRQFRYPTYVNGNATGFLIETAAGLLDMARPDDRIKQEVEEETGFRLLNVEPVFTAYMSPGSVTEQVFFYTGAYEKRDQVSDGGGNVSEGEDIEVLEIPFDTAMSMISQGTICDGKTIMLLQHAALTIFSSPPVALSIAGDV